MSEYILYDSLAKLKIITFWEIINTSDYMKLLKNYDENVNYPLHIKKQCADTWLRLYDEYFTVKNESRAKVALENEYESTCMAATLKELSNHYNNLENLLNFEVVDSLKEAYEQLVWEQIELFPMIDSRIVIDRELGIRESVARIESFIQSAITTYEIKKSSSKKQLKKEFNLYKNVVQVENILGRSIMGLDTMSALQWLATEELAIEKLKALKKEVNG